MEGTRLFPGLREKLANAGFIRVDGLKVTFFDPLSPILIKGLDSDKRCWDSNNGMCVVAVYGEVWLGISGQKIKERNLLAQELGLETGCFVPCSNGEIPNWKDFLRRLADPDWIPKY